MKNSASDKRVVNHAFKPSRGQVSFFLIATGFILLVGLLVAVMMPQLTAWRWSVVDRLVAQAKNEQNSQYKLSLLEQAKLIGGQDPVATEALAQFWLNRGEIDKAIAVYQSVENPNYLRMGYLALNAQDYNKALNLYKKASSDQQSAESLVGEAVASYNQEKISDGCEKSLQAVKLNLQSKSAKAAVTSCVILGGTQAEAVSLAGQQPAMSERETAFFLINNQIYKVGESRLNAITDKTVTDWLVLSRLANVRGDKNLAISQAEKGLELDPSNVDVNTELIKLYRLTGSDAKANELSARLQQLQFTKYQ